LSSAWSERSVLPIRTKVETSWFLGTDLYRNPIVEARLREYAAAAGLIRAEGGFPNLSLEKTADICHFQVMYRSAISTLDRLAGEAEVGLLPWFRHFIVGLGDGLRVGREVLPRPGHQP
jgi:hypothetical protein